MIQKKTTKKNRIVITGLGAVTSLGIGWQEFWKNLIAGKSGISEVTSIDTSKHERHFAGEIKNFDPSKFMSKQRSSLIGRSSQFAIAATKLALEDANLDYKSIDNDKVGVCIGMTMAEMGILEGYNEIYEENKSRLKKFKLLNSFPANSVTANVARFFKFSNQNVVFSTACAAGNYSVAQAYDLLQNDDIQYVVAGGSDSFSRVVYTGFSRLFAIAPDKCQPFDKNRQGMIPGEGSGMVVLETLENAQKRGAEIYAELIGFGCSCDGEHMTSPSAKGVSKAINRALQASKVGKGDIDYICAHGTGTKENDKAECEALHLVFNSKAKTIPVSSIKSMLGHTMGAASAIETIACCLAIKNSKIPPTINFNDNDPECNIDCVANKSRTINLKTILNSSQAFGGNNFSIILKVL